MRKLASVAGLWVVAMAACAPKPSSIASSAPGEVSTAGASNLALEPLGPPLEVAVPLLGGSSVELAELRGRVVLLEVSSTDRDHWAASQQQYRQLADEFGDDRLVVVSVASDPDAARLRQFWDRDKPPFVLAWDPQGALALRLGITVLPTAFVLDRQGRPLAEVTGGAPDFGQRVEQTVRAAVSM